MLACILGFLLLEISFGSLIVPQSKKVNTLKTLVVNQIIFCICLTIKCLDFRKISATDHFITCSCFKTIKEGRSEKKSHLRSVHGLRG